MKTESNDICMGALIGLMISVLLCSLVAHGQDGLTPVEGKNKHKRVDPVTPAPQPDIKPEPDPEFTEVVDIEKRPRPRPQPQPDSVEPVAPSKPVVIHKGSWSSWFGGVFFGMVVGLGAAWASTLTSIRHWIGL